MKIYLGTLIGAAVFFSPLAVVVGLALVSGVRSDTGFYLLFIPGVLMTWVPLFFVGRWRARREVARHMDAHFPDQREKAYRLNIDTWQIEEGSVALPQLNAELSRIIIEELKITPEQIARELARRHSQRPNPAQPNDNQPPLISIRKE
jgi:hypothetical protein